MAEHVLASPTKRFFIDMLVRDIRLEGAILDLIDNSIDSYIRTSGLVLDASLLTAKKQKKRAQIAINITGNTFSIKDNCGGIDQKKAETEVFRFGTTTKSESSQGGLSVYGIGLKRAIFKLGKDINIESHTTDSGFEVTIDTDSWVNEPEKPGVDWTFPMTMKPPANSPKTAGTKITVRKLTPEVKMRLDDGAWMNRLKRRISEAYSLFVGKFIDIKLNSTEVLPLPVPIGASDQFANSFESFEVGRTSVEIITSLCAQPWTAEKAGWYYFCNGRTVLTADKSELTGWSSSVGSFQPKYRGFIGLVFCSSDDPELLPWTTTKTGLNTESEVYQATLNKMAVQSRAVLRFLDKMYSPSKESEAEPQRKIAQESTQIELAELDRRVTAQFKTSVSNEPKIQMSSVTIKVEKEKIDNLKRVLKKPNWSNKQVVEHAFDYLYDQECV